ncbi:MAG: hypothetical protein U5L03_08730 [Burkholderiaceae bacterium]|nr:hypothetical protein [Burkholderiaceae bacterium]
MRRLRAERITGGGTGAFVFEGCSAGVCDEIQPGWYMPSMNTDLRAQRDR